MRKVDCLVVVLVSVLCLVFDGYEFSCATSIVIAMFLRFASNKLTA